MKDLNQKLAEWLGLDPALYNDEPTFIVEWGLDFTTNLNACFEYLVPKVREVLDIEEISFSYRDTGKNVEVFICYWPHTGNKEADNYILIYEAEAETPAFAFCLAVEKIINEKGK